MPALTAPDETFDEARILRILDACCSAYTFTMLDNGYVYPAAARLTLHRSAANWAIVIETFGFSPRAGLPDITIQTYAHALHNRDLPEQYVTPEAHANYLASNPHNEFRSAWPLDEGVWQDTEDAETLATGPAPFLLRGEEGWIPDAEDVAAAGITLVAPPRVAVFEFCRWLAATEREAVLATTTERRVSLTPDLEQILQLEEWNHPDLGNGQTASDSETFRQLARVLATGDIACYLPTQPPNTHWRFWPQGGTL